MINISNFLKTSLVYLILQSFIVILYFMSYIPPWIFVIFITILFISSKPKLLFSPKNIVFAYYLIWYGIAPQFATRFSGYLFNTKEENLAYLMFFGTYGILIVLLTLFETLFSKKTINHYLNSNESSNNANKRMSIIAKFSFVSTFIFLIAFIEKTGGIQYWLVDSTMAYIGRRGAGIYYLLFTHSFMIYCVAIGYFIYIKKNVKLFFFQMLTILILFPFIGSKAKVILMVLITISYFIINNRTFSKLTIGIGLASFIIFGLGIYQRNITWMKLNDFIPYTLNYFNTLEMFMITLRDFEPSFMVTFLLPFNKILLHFGEYISVPFSDISVWLSSIYYPKAHALGATEQWPIEADMYMSFYYIFALPVLAVYSYWLGFAFNKAQEGYVSWLLIYSLEFVLILSHLRGGLLSWGYIYFIFFYIFALIIFGNIRVNRR
ncbi:hypothetical protein [Fusibacter ferrireducens]|uniref:Oligosaccharide repeat unit polymerase n=1 Tax=Fusibacter ferrireducens TaxID=2785058 RepID=A0ABR9ZXE8_9FIRM|nr:hypothetical protein [Fusibacter ferrireducens]MBF4695139.1 hypothetical protein [Fusibacter ferrireducens]